MNVKFEKLETNVVKLEVTVDAVKFGEAIKKAYAKNGKKFNVAGFRKGKAPMNIIKKYYGEGVFFEDAINICIEETYPEALVKEDVHPVDYPEIDIVDMGEGKDLVYTAKVTVVPEVELGEYKGLEVKKVSYPITEEDVLKELKEMQEKNARVEVKVEGEVQNGNLAVIDFKGFVDGVVFEGGEGKDYSLEIGSKSFIDNFEEQLIGAKIGELKEIKVNFPEAYGKEELNGKPALFEVTVKEIKEKHLPELDDEFAKEVSEFDTIEEFKASIIKKQEEANKERETREYEDAVIDAVCANTKIEVPAAMVKKETDNMLKDLEMRLKYQGLDMTTYYEYTGSSEDKMREFMKVSAEKKVIVEMVIDKIAKVEEVVATEEELKEKAAEIAKQYGQEDLEKTVDMLLKVQAEYLRISVVNEKVVKMLVSSSKVIG